MSLASVLWGPKRKEDQQMKTLLAVGVQVDQTLEPFIRSLCSRTQPLALISHNEYTHLGIMQTPHLNSQNSTLFLSPQNCLFDLTSHLYKGDHSYNLELSYPALTPPFCSSHLPKLLSKITELLRQISSKFIAREAQRVTETKGGSPCRCPGKL